LEEFRLRRTDSLSQQISEYLDSSQKMESIREILHEYATSVLDLSVHEVSVHNLKHSSVNLEGFYLRLEGKFLNETVDFITALDPRHLGKNFIENYFSMDLQLVSDIFLNRTLSIYIKRVAQRWIEMIQPNPKNGVHGEEGAHSLGVQNRHSSMNMSNMAENADFNLLLRNSMEPIHTLSSGGPSKKSSELIKYLQGHLLESMVNRTVDTDSEEEPEKKNEDPLKKANSYVEPTKRRDSRIQHSTMYRSLSQCTDEGSGSPVTDNKELAAHLVSKPNEETLRQEVPREVHGDRQAHL
jgi:hypothetical protein